MHNICIVLITYNPNLEELQKNISSYITQVKKVVIVDNSTTTDILPIIKKFDNIHSILLGDNLGIAKAQNIGIQYAFENGFDFVVEMDQDSCLPNNYINDIYESYKILENQGHKVAGIGPLSINKENGNTYLFDSHIDNNDFLIEVSETLSSGFFTPKKSFEIVGYKNEDFFIDYVDWEWNWRAKKFGLKNFINKKLVIEHMLGNGHKKILFWEIGIPAPIRHYYQYRNSLNLMKIDYLSLSWKIKRIFINFIKIFLILIFLDRKLLRLKYVFCGIKDFFKNKKGKISCVD